MASYQNVKVVNLIAGEDLTGDVYELLTVENDSGVAKVIKATGPTVVPVGVLAENPSVASDGVTVPVVLLAAGGVAKVKAGAAITAGQLVIADSTAGRVAGVASLAAMAADNFAIGIALQTAADGDVFEVLLQPMTSALEGS